MTPHRVRCLARVANSEPQPFVATNSGPLLVGGFVSRFFSLSGLVPLGVFLAVHLYVNARVLSGDAAYASAVGAVDRVLFAPWLRWLLVIAPLAFHAIIGAWLVIRRAPLPEPRPYPKGLRAAMRATGVGALAFLAVHLSPARAAASGLGAWHGASSSDGFRLASRLAAELSSTWHGVPWRAVAYLFGSACVTFHFVVGSWGFFAVTRGGRTPRARRGAAWGAAAAGIGLAVFFANIVVYYATGARLWGSPTLEQGPAAECPARPR